MKFTDSLVIELPVRNSLISLQQDNRSMHVGTSVWPCSLVLIKFIDRWAPPTTNDKPLLPTAWSRACAKPDSDYLLGLSTKYLSLWNLPKCRHCAIQAWESDPNQSSTANKVLSIADVLVTAENPFHNRHLDYYSILQIRRSESRTAGSFEPSSWNSRGSSTQTSTSSLSPTKPSTSYVKLGRCCLTRTREPSTRPKSIRPPRQHSGHCAACGEENKKGSGELYWEEWRNGYGWVEMMRVLVRVL